ncbi:MAG TPA: hemolysin family protein [Phycisphaerae bacterium]|nr:hemolysin family protein [Phycisphaerae bacterium]
MTLQAFLDSIPHLLVMAVLIALSGFISASETALFALSRQQLSRLRQSPRAVDQLVLHLREQPRSLLSTVLLSNIAVNTLLYSILAVTAVKLAGGSPLWTTIFGVIGFVIVLAGGEIGPKLIALGTSERLAPLVAAPVRLLEAITLPLRWLFEGAVVEPFTRIICGSDRSGSRGAQSAVNIHAEDLQRLVRSARLDGLISELENAVLHRVMDLSDLRVSALMIPRVDLIAFNLAHDKNELLELIKRSRLLRIPVYEGNIDNIRGVVHAKEFLLNPDAPLKQLIHPARFIPEQAGVEALLQHFRSTGSKSALVVDEYGGIAGIVAMEDVVEAIVGEFYTPGEASVPPNIHRINDTTFLVDGQLQVDEFRRAFDVPIEETRVNTVAGLVAQTLDRIPQRGDQITIGPATLAVLAMKDRRIVRLRLTLAEPPRGTPELLMLQQPPPPDDRPSAGPERREAQ